MASLGGLTWDAQGQHYYYTGIDGVALYVWDDTKDPDPEAVTPRGWYGAPVAWSGVTAVNESPSGAESNKLYADNNEYLNLLSKEEFGLTLESYQVPDDVYSGSTLVARGFDWCDGIFTVGAMKVRGQSRRSFGLVYRIQKGSDTTPAGAANDKGFVYHIIYGCKASPSSRDYATVNDSPEAQTFSYEITTTDLTQATKVLSDTYYPGVTKLVHLEVDDADLDEDTLPAFLAAIYGTSTTPLTQMPTPDDLSKAIAEAASNG